MDNAKITEVYKLAKKLQDFFNETAHPQDLLASAKFVKGVELFGDPQHTTADILEYATGDNPVIACMALEALCRRPADKTVTARVLDDITDFNMWALYFALKYLGNHADSPVIGRVLAKTPKWWRDYNVVYSILNAFIECRLAKGEVLEWAGGRLDLDSSRIRQLRPFLRNLLREYREPLINELNAFEARQVDTRYLNSVGRVWDPKKDSDDIVEFPDLSDEIAEMADMLLGATPTSYILVGPAGIGKTALIQVLARRLHAAGWRIFEAGASDVLAGRVYIGELEERIRELAANLERKRKVIWLVPNLHELSFAGRYRYNPTGALDMLMPHIESGRLLMIGEIEHGAYERLVRENKRLRAAFTTVILPPVPDDITLTVAGEWDQRQAAKDKKRPRLDAGLIDEALHLCRQFMTDKAAPGNILDLLKQTFNRVRSQRPDATAVTLDDLFVTVSQSTGLPEAILDDRQGLDLDKLRATFEERVMGQSEAIDVLIQRVAMIKAGLTDPGRPYGVFLFAGPTGTGKTEIAKTLARYLFGSDTRMIRLDMSEFKYADSIHRINGSPGFDSGGDSLATQIRKEPFSVILLDEFEKAHYNVWDLFLQVFDDGRLTDRQGNTADFRHAIIILTSNLGAKIDTGLNIGFSGTTGAFSQSEVEKTIRSTFRPEFINRIDRTIVFHPLSRAVMRDILYKELDLVLTRRGLRKRQWCVEWEESAIDFLLHKGFTPDMGARPLKRAIEQYLLSPLALTIVTHQHPDGDQFLFVRSDGEKIRVEFIDPDASATEEKEARTPARSRKAPAKVRLEDIILHAYSHPAALDLLNQAYDRLEEEITAEEWTEEKNSLLLRVSEPGFWDDPGRFTILGNIEYRDRMETALETAGSLMKRVKPGMNGRHGDLVQRLASQLYLLEKAREDCVHARAKDVFVVIEGTYPRQKGRRALMLQHAAELRAMYQQWAKRRRMSSLVLCEEDDGAAKQLTTVLAVSGLGAHAILAAEAGLHIFEGIKKDKAPDRIKLKVRVLPQAETPYPDRKAMLADARERMAAAGEGETATARTYRRGSNPLVKDNARGWRTGKLEEVLDGNFDVLSPA